MKGKDEVLRVALAGKDEALRMALAGKDEALAAKNGEIEYVRKKDEDLGRRELVAALALSVMLAARDASTLRGVLGAEEGRGGGDFVFLLFRRGPHRVSNSPMSLEAPLPLRRVCFP